MTKKIVWRLKETPTADALRELVKDGILLKDEAREILFTQDTEEERDKKSLESEIKFLRELVDKLSKSKTEIVETIKYIEVPYRRWDWYKPYYQWQSDIMLCASNTETNALQTFNSIKTF